MIRPEIEALLQGALDDTLTPDERARLARVLSESREARERSAQLEQLTGLIDALGAADAPPRLAANVLAQVTNRPHTVRPSTLKRGVPVNKTVLFGLAAAAAVVLAVITFSSNPPATEGTEATIGAAQRAQAPQIAANDVKLGDTSTQDVLQTEMWDQIAKDENLRTALQDENFRAQLLNVELRTSLSDQAVLRALRDPLFAKQIQDQALTRSLNDDALVQKLNQSNLKLALQNKAFLRAIRNSSFRQNLSREGLAAALAQPAFQDALRSRSFEAAIRDPKFSARLARGAKAQ